MFFMLVCVLVLCIGVHHNYIYNISQKCLPPHSFKNVASITLSTVACSHYKTQELQGTPTGELYPLYPLYPINRAGESLY